MANVLQSAVSWLAGTAKSSMGTAVTYTRPGLGSVALTATLGSQLLKVTDSRGNVRYERTDRDFLFTAADLVIAGSTVLPEPADVIDVAVGTATERFEVMPVNGGREPAWRYSDPFKTVMRVHTKFVGSSADTILDPVTGLPVGDETGATILDR